MNQIHLGPNTSLYLTATTSGWSSNAPYTQTLTSTGVTANSIITVGLGSVTSAQYEAAASAKLCCTAQGNGSITITSFGKKPSLDIPITVQISG